MEFHENLASYLLEAEQPLAITRSWGFCGYCIPGRRKRTEVAAQGISEKQVIGDFKRWRRSDRR